MSGAISGAGVSPLRLRRIATPRRRSAASGLGQAILLPLYGGAFLESDMSRDHLVEQAIQRICAAAEQAGEITFSQINALLPAVQFTPEQIEQIINRLSEKEIGIIED
jgi:hypothetical protein